MHIRATRPQWVNPLNHDKLSPFCDIHVSLYAECYIVLSLFAFDQLKLHLNHLRGELVRGNMNIFLHVWSSLYIEKAYVVIFPMWGGKLLLFRGWYHCPGNSDSTAVVLMWFSSIPQLLQHIILSSYQWSGHRRTAHNSKTEIGSTIVEQPWENIVMGMNHTQPDENLGTINCSCGWI